MASFQRDISADYGKSLKNRFSFSHWVVIHFVVQGRIQADAWKPRLQHDFFKYGISPGLSEKKL